MHVAKHHRNNQSKAYSSPVEYPGRVYMSNGNTFNQIFHKKVHGQRHPGRWAIAETNLHIPEISLDNTLTRGDHRNTIEQTAITCYTDSLAEYTSISYAGIISTIHNVCS